MRKSKQQSEELSSVIAAELRFASAELDQAQRKRADFDEVIEVAKARLETTESMWRRLPTEGISAHKVDLLRYEARSVRERGGIRPAFSSPGLSPETRRILTRMAARIDAFATRVEGLLA